MYKKSTAFGVIALCALFFIGCTKSQEGAEQVDVEMSEEKMKKEDQKTAEMTGEPENTDIRDAMTTNSATSYTDISVSEAKNLIDTSPELIILDVSPKYEEGHIPGAINHYVGDGSLDEAIPTLDPSDMYLVYCHNDAASTLGAQKLVDAGFEYVYRLEGNYGAWVDAGYPTEK